MPWQMQEPEQQDAGHIAEKLCPSLYYLSSHHIWQILTNCKAGHAALARRAMLPFKSWQYLAGLPAELI